MTFSQACTEHDFATLLQQDRALVQVKAALHDERRHLKQRFDPQVSPATLLKDHACCIDHLLRACWTFFLADAASGHALIATGGYGRAELFPHSDIDLLILLDESRPDTGISAFSNFLWDIGLKPGLSVRSIDECIAAADADQTIFTGLLEIRIISGNTTLMTALLAKLERLQPWPSERFFLAKLDEQTRRYAKFHDTAYNLEPNIKESPGGLRDLQTIAWVFKRHYQSQSLRELIKYGFLPQAEYDSLIASRDNLWRLRFALHTLTDKCEDRLLFDYQRELATLFGYTHANQQPDVERFMQFLFRTVREIEYLNEILLQLLHERLLSHQDNLAPIPITLNFTAIAGFIEVSDETVFSRNPLEMFNMFLILQQSPSLKGVRATTIRLIRNNLHLIDDDFRHNKQANRLFMDIIRQPRGITHQLRRMNRYGILAAYLPDFANIVGRMQYDLFHIYTVDQHTLFVIRNLRRFTLAKHRDELPFCHNIFLLTPKPDVLYIAALFHDIAKGLGGDHSTLGEGIARQFCQQHDLSRHDTDLITWLVRQHLLMSMTAQRKDISDPDVIHSFAQHVGSIEHLNYLYLLTVADIRATNPGLWNGWKDALLKDLYIATHQALHRGLHHPVVRSEKIRENRSEARRELEKLGVDSTLIERSWSHLSDEYFLRYSSDEIAWHSLAIAACHDDDLPLVLLRPQTVRGSAEVFIYTRNEALIFSLCTATLDQLGLTILDARIITTNAQYVLNSFQILEQSGEPITDLYREQHICDALRAALKSKTVKTSRNIHKQSRQARHFPIETRITFLDDADSPYTVIELITTDRAGLLSTLGQAFNHLDIQLHDAKITTIGSRAEDMFYVSDLLGKPVTDTVERQKIHDTMRRFIEKTL